MKICAIHQPNFFPWLGYFDKIHRADVFVFLDRVHYPKSGNSMGSWCNRVKVNVGGHGTWISCPVVREHGVQFIDTVRIDNGRRPWRDDLRKVFETNYRTSANFENGFSIVDRLLKCDSERLADFNMNAIRCLAGHFGSQTEFVRQSDLPPGDATATARLVAICRAVGADAYLCGAGAGGYQDDNVFAEAGVRMVYQNFEATSYGDPKRFIPGLSVIDWLMHESTSPHERSGIDASGETR